MIFHILVNGFHVVAADLLNHVLVVLALDSEGLEELIVVYDASLGEPVSQRG